MTTDLNEACDLFYRNIVVAKDYLLERGINGTMAQRYRLGHVAQPIPGWESYVGRLSIPYLSPSGEVLDIRFRLLHDGDFKYLGRPGVTPRLYEARSLAAGGPLAVIAEGEMSALVTGYFLQVPTVGVPGVQAWVSREHDHWPRCFDGFDRVLVLCDGDQPGRDLGKAIAQSLEQAVVIHMPDGEDPDSVVLKYGADELRRMVGL